MSITPFVLICVLIRNTILHKKIRFPDRIYQKPDPLRESLSDAAMYQKPAVFRLCRAVRPVSSIRDEIMTLTNVIAESLPSSDCEEECVFLCRNLHGTQNLS